MNFVNLAIFQFAATGGSRSLAYELSRRQLHLYYSLTQGQHLSLSFAQFPSVRHCLYVSKEYKVAFEFVLVFMTKLEKFYTASWSLAGTQNFSLCTGSFLALPSSRTA